MALGLVRYKKGPCPVAYSEISQGGGARIYKSYLEISQGLFCPRTIKIILIKPLALSVNKFCPGYLETYTQMEYVPNEYNIF